MFQHIRLSVLTNTVRLRKYNCEDKAVTSEQFSHYVFNALSIVRV